jgi:hypothetical protein
MYIPGFKVFRETGAAQSSDAGRQQVDKTYAPGKYSFHI